MTPDSPSATAPPRILYVDDDVVLGRLVSRDLMRNGFAVMSATDGNTAIALLKTTEFDLSLIHI